MVGKFLTNKQRNELLRELRSERSRKYADRIRVILLLDEGKAKLIEHLSCNLYISTNMIVLYIKKEFNVNYTISGVTKLLYRLGFSYKKAKPLPINACLDKQKEFFKKI